MGRLPSQLRTRVVLLALLTLMPAVAVIGYSQWRARRYAHERAADETLRIARLAAAEQAAVFDGTRRLLLTLAEVPAISSDADARVCAEILPNVLRDHPDFFNLTVFTDAGLEFCTARPLDPKVSAPVADRPWFQRAVQQRGTALGDYQISRTSGKPAIVLAHAILDAPGNVRRVIAASINLRELSATATRAKLAPGSTLVLVGQNGTILSRIPDGDRWVGRSVADRALQKRMRGSPEDVSEHPGVDGITRVYVTVPVRGEFPTGLALSVGIVPEGAVAVEQALLREYFWLLSILSLALVAAALALGELFIVNPIGRLSAVTTRLAAGDFSARAQLAAGVPGVRDLGAAVDEMAAALEDRQQQRDRDERARAFLAALVTNSDDAILGVELDGAVASWNRGAERLYGYEAREVVGQHVSLVIPAPVIADAISRLRGEESVIRGDAVHRHKNGSTVPVSLSMSAIRAGTGAITGVSLIARDISERLQAERALHDAEERMHFALAASRVGVWEGNLLTRRYYWSAIHERMHGLAEGAFDGTIEGFYACIHRDDREQVRRSLIDAHETHRDTELEYRTVWPDGTERWIRASVHYSCDEQGQLTRGAGIAMDVTERRSLEDQLRQAQKMEAVGQLAGGIAHDFNNLLTGIIGNTELVLADLPAGDPRRHELEEVAKASNRAAALTQHLLAFSRRSMLAPRVLRLGELVQGLAPMLRRVLSETIDLRTVVSDRSDVKVDAARMEQVVLNLAINSRDAMPNGGRLTIETHDVVLDEDIAHRHPELRPGRYVMLAVSDTGEGMTPEVQRSVFEPFFTTKPHGRGTGLGLAMVFGTMQQSGGHIFVYSEVGRGTTFKLYLPEVQAERIAADAPVPQTANGTETVLLIEDEATVREFVALVLTRAGYSVHAMATPALASAFAKSYQGCVDAIVSDVVLPGQDGPALVVELRRRWPTARVLYMSGYTGDAIVHRGVLEQDVAFLQKPFPAEALRQKLRAVLDAALT